MVRQAGTDKVTLSGGNWLAIIATVLVPVGTVLMKLHEYTSETKTQIAVMQTELKNQGNSIADMKTKLDKFSERMESTR